MGRVCKRGEEWMGGGGDGAGGGDVVVYICVFMC